MFVAPIAGFGLGLVGDKELMHGSHEGHGGSELSCCGSGHTREEETKNG